MAAAESYKKKVTIKTSNFFNRTLQPQQATRLAVLTVAWLAFLLRVIDLRTQSLWRDEVDAIRFSEWPLPELVSGLFHHGHNGPLFFLGLRPWRILTGNSEFALRYPSALLGALAIPLGFVLARQLGFQRQVGILLGLLLATSPYLIWYGQEAKMYTLLAALIMLAFIAYLKALQGARWPAPLPGEMHAPLWWATFVIATSLSFYTHILSPLMLIVYGVVAFLLRACLREHWRGWLISMACLTIPYLPLAVWQIPLLLEGFQSGHPDYSASEIISILLRLYSMGLARFIGLAGPILYIFLLLAGLFFRDRTQKKGQIFNPPKRLILAGWTFLPPLIVYLISLRVNVFEDRYLIYITPAFYLIVVMGLMRVKQSSRRLAWLCLSSILVINLMGVWRQQSQPIKADFRGAATYLYSQPQPPAAIMVQTPYLQHTLNHYYQTDYKLLEGPWTNNGKSEADLHAEMIERIGDLADLWVIISEETLWDSRGLTRRWLDQNADLIEQVDFTRVKLYHYRLSPPAPAEQYAREAGENEGGAYPALVSPVTN